MILEIPLTRLRAIKPLVRDDEWANLTTDMHLTGQHTNLLVREVGNHYEIVDGNKRLHAAFRLGWKTLKCETVT